MPNLAESIRLRLALAAVALILIFAGGVSAEPVFDGETAFAHVRALVEIGPRPPGSRGALEAQKYILKKHSGDLTEYLLQFS